jgi:demethylmenaquinone methyltransferase/2-methoxy-6-polyprenyl-1,4-benzoquinol methylase
MSNIEVRSDAARSSALVAGYYADPIQRSLLVRGLFNRSAQHYDKVNRLFSLGSGAWYRRRCLRRAGVRPGVKIVDVAVGTGLLAREAITLTGDHRALTGVDISEAMLAIARKKLRIPLIQAAAEALPLAPGIADFVTMGYALRHVADLEAAFREAIRILRPGGTIVLLEISPPRNRLSRALAKIYIGGIVPVLSLLMTRDHRARTLMLYHWQSIASYLAPEIVTSMMAASSFENVKCETEFGLFQLYTGRKAEGCAATDHHDRRDHAVGLVIPCNREP